MTRWDIGVLARAAHAEIRGGALPVSVEAVGTDSRSLPPNALFVALRGPRFDGHTFAAQAVKAGARAVLADREGDAALRQLGAPRLVVSDTLRALGDLARFVRRSRGRPVVAVTGSNGKTTTKELIAAALSPRGAIHKTQGNLNNLVGLPLTLLAWPEQAAMAVVEMGMSAPGEIRELTAIAEPEVGVVTNVGPAHLHGLGSLERVAAAKGELYAGLAQGATAILNADDPVVNKVCTPLVASRRVIRFGAAKGADVQSVKCVSDETGSQVTLRIGRETVEAHLPLFGEHNALNAAAAAAAAWALGLAAHEIAEGLARVTPTPGRMQVLPALARGVRVIDDTYNANPASMHAAFKALAALARQSRRVAVLGDMLELGPDAAALHREVGMAAAKAGVQWLLCLGEHAAATAGAASEQGVQAQAFSDLEPLLQALVSGLAQNDWVVVKGSRGAKMERVVHALQDRLGVT